MKRLPNTELTQQDIERICNNPFQTGGEAVIATTDKPNSLYKIFIDYEDYDAVDELGLVSTEAITDMSDNKFSKIKKLYAMQLEHSIKPLSTLTQNGRLVGYEMSFDPLDTSLDKKTLTHSEKIHCLTETKRILEYFATKDIVYGDVANRNILINQATGQVTFCDIDNIQLNQYPIDIMSTELENYFYVRGIDESTDTYMHNLLTIAQIDNWGSYEVILNAIGNRQYPDGFKRQARKTFKSMESPETSNGETLLQYVKTNRR